MRYSRYIRFTRYSENKLRLNAKKAGAGVTPYAKVFRSCLVLK